MPEMTDKETRRFCRDRWCGICHRLIPAGTTCYIRQQVLVGECHRAWMEKNVAPDPAPRRHKGKLKTISAREFRDLRDTSHYTLVFGRRLARDSRNTAGIKRAIKDYEGSFNDW